MPRATPEKVAAAWISSIPTLSTQMVGSLLPEDSSTWAATGFITVTVHSGNPHIYLPISQPVVQVECWTVTPGSAAPPWGQAADLAEVIRAATYVNDQRWLTIPYADTGARVMSAYLTHEPRRKYGDTGDYACVTADLALYWVTV